MTDKAQVGDKEDNFEMSRPKYQAVLSCACGRKEPLSDKDYEDILMDRKDIVLQCGHSKYGAKIQAKHNVDVREWRFMYGSSK
jgi:hypothetical protein